LSLIARRNLAFLTMGALNAATGMVVTIHPQMVDVASMSQFLLMTSELVSVIEEAGGQLQYDFLKFLVTRHDPRDVPEQEIVALLRDLFGHGCVLRRRPGSRRRSRTQG
jgi:chromosome partitioning protein